MSPTNILGIICGIQILFCIALLIALFKSNGTIIDMNKKLLILAMGREKNVEGLRALVASEKPPQGKLRGIATQDKKDPKSKNTNYEMSIGGH